MTKKGKAINSFTGKLMYIINNTPERQNGTEKGYSGFTRVEAVEAIKELIKIHVIREDFDIAAEMEKVERDFHKLGNIAATGQIINSYKADQRSIIDGDDKEIEGGGVE